MLGGTFNTKHKAMVDFKLIELSLNKEISWTVHVDDTTDPNKSQFDMIIGTDLMSELGINIDFDTKRLKWEENEIPLHQYGSEDDSNHVYEVYLDEMVAPNVKQSMDRSTKILDADYSVVDLPSIVDAVENLETTEKTRLLTLLKKYSSLFQGGLGALSIKSIKLELKEGAQPYSGKLFPIPQAYGKTTKKEI